MKECRKAPQDRLGDWMENRTNELVNEILTKLGVSTDQVMPKDTHLPDVELAKYIGKILADKYPGYMFEMFPLTKQKKSFLLTTSLTTSKGLHALRSFIDTGSCGIEEDISSPYDSALTILDGFLRTTENQLKEVISGETASKHDSRHQRQVKKIMM